MASGDHFPAVQSNSHPSHIDDADGQSDTLADLLSAGVGGEDMLSGASWDGDFAMAEAPAKPVKGNWLDAFQGENMDVYRPGDEHIAAVTPDDNGLYRFFRSRS